MRFHHIAFFSVVTSLVSACGSADAPARDPAACVDALASRLHIDFDMRTDPALLHTMVHDEMLLGELPEVTSLLGQRIENAEPLRPLIETVRDDVVHQHPEIREFLCDALEKGDIPEVEAGSDAIKRTIHQAFLLEILTARMIEDRAFMDAVHDHLIAQREKMGLGTEQEIYDATGGLFEVAKTKSIDQAMRNISLIRERGSVELYEMSWWRDGLDVNILEATTTESRNSFHDNAAAGVALLGKPIRKMNVTSETREIELEMSAAWANLYESWNLAFITANVGHADILFPKLLIPSVVGAPANAYIFRRILALWLSINFYLFAQVRGSADVTVPNREALAASWGTRNRRMAESLEEDSVAGAASVDAVVPQCAGTISSAP